MSERTRCACSAKTDARGWCHADDCPMYAPAPGSASPPAFDDHRPDGPDPLPNCHCAEVDRLFASTPARGNEPVRERDALIAQLEEAEARAEAAEREVFNLRLIAETVKPGDHERAIAKIAREYRERAEAAERERDRLKQREEHFAKALRVADGGQYRADWDGAIDRVVKERDEARAALSALREGVRGLLRAFDRPAMTTRHGTDQVVRSIDALRALLGGGDAGKGEGE